MHFKLSNYDLGVELGRWKDKLPSTLCTRRVCDQRALDDEFHLNCECSAMQSVGEHYPHFLWQSTNMSRLLACRRQKSLFKLVRDLFEHRKQLQSPISPDGLGSGDDIHQHLSTCMCICSLFGHFSVALLFLILLQSSIWSRLYLPLFGSESPAGRHGHNNSHS